MPAVGNGYVSTFVMSDELHVAGVYNGKSNVDPSDTKLNSKLKNYSDYYAHTHRARLPSQVSINFTLNTEGERSFALDVQYGVFYQWFHSPTAYIEQRIYAHHSMKNIIVNEINLRTSESIRLNLIINNGSKSVDINFHQLESDDDLFEVVLGKVNETEVPNVPKTQVCIVWTKIPKYIDFQKSPKLQSFRFLVAITTSLEYDDPVTHAIELWKTASYQNDLFESHIIKWEGIWKQTNITVDQNIYLSQVVYSSLYNILSSIREDTTHGVSPGGLAGGEEYLGHVFWDQDIWMYPSILLMHPELAKSLLQYRYEKLNSALDIAQSFGYKGMYSTDCL